MTPLEFGEQVDRLKVLYSEKNFPEERIKVMWNRYSGYPAKSFALAVDWVVLSMPSPGAVVGVLDDKLSYARKETASIERLDPKYTCEPCRDFGYGWIGHTVVACTCPRGERISPEELFKQQKNYDRGRRFIKTPADLAKLLGREE